jgi:hypothetical protein
MIDEKIDHHFNELSPIDFNIYDDFSLLKKLKKEDVSYDKAYELHSYTIGVIEQIKSVINEEDEHLAVIYNFLSASEQQDYLKFLRTIEHDVIEYIRIKKNLI